MTSPEAANCAAGGGAPTGRTIEGIAALLAAALATPKACSWLEEYTGIAKERNTGHRNLFLDMKMEMDIPKRRNA